MYVIFVMCGLLFIGFVAFIVGALWNAAMGR
jgi:hypothetical protein